MTYFLSGTLSLFVSLAQLEIFQIAVAGAVLYGVVSITIQVLRG